ncbi:MAG: topoisomerase DNA-binding C4 zinc finger domain-containing protein [Verrucomicrobia bacterium]|nr:topoisomerase DNA-binding C4 zinc finger domain-containing protein [Verrucomicrobiota bacterium]
MGLIGLIGPIGLSHPPAPQCGQRMVLRTARKGPRAGSRFWGCAGYPNCKGTRPADA